MARTFGLTAYQRGGTWWAKGRIACEGRPISGYLRESTGAATEAGARQWIAEREEAERRRHLNGDAPVARIITFASLIDDHARSAKDAPFLIPIIKRIGHLSVAEITPRLVRDLGPILYPDAATDTWLRQVVTPVRSVINAAHDALGGDVPPIRIKGYSEKERLAQDARRGKASRVERKPGSWEWLLAFRTEADDALAALALFMFASGARIGQATAMHPDHHLDRKRKAVKIPAAKGVDARWIILPEEVFDELANLPRRVPRFWPRTAENLRLFGFASGQGVHGRWRKTCERAGIECLTPHSAGRHGFGQEYNVRNPVDEQAAAAFGGWANPVVMKGTYTHAEDETAKIHAQFRTGLVQAERATGLKLLKS